MPQPYFPPMRPRLYWLALACVTSRLALSQTGEGSVRASMGLAAGGNDAIRPGVPALLAQVNVARPLTTALDADLGALVIVQLDQRSLSTMLCPSSGCQSQWGLNLAG